MMYPMGRYNLNFDLAAGLLDLLLLFVLFRKRRVRSFRARIFFGMVAVTALAAFGEFATGALRNCGSRNLLLLEIATGAAHYFYISTGYMLFLYLLELTGGGYGMSRRRKLLISLPEYMLTAVMLLPFFRKMAYSYDAAGQYTRGNFYDFYAVVIAFYAVSCLILMLRYRKALGGDFWYLLVLYAGWMGSFLLELVSPYLRVSVFLQSLFLAGCTILMDNGEEFQDAETGLLSGYALNKDARVLFGDHYSSCLIAVKLQHYSYYSMMLGTEMTSGILQKIGVWLQNMAGRDSKVYRTGPGEFVILRYNCQREEAEPLAELLRERFCRSWQYGPIKLPVVAQIWMTQLPEKVKTPEQLAFFAQSGYNDRLPKNRIYMADEMWDEERRVSVEMAVKRALDGGSLQVFYQPIYDTRCGKIHSAEALIRLKDEKLGMISPEEFIGIAEQTGMISQIGEFVFEQVCRFLASGAAQRAGLEFVEINLSTVQCMDAELSGRLLSIAEQYGISPSEINLEITESAMIYSKETMRKVMGELQAEGFSFALDDFGTGRANYSYLKDFPFRLIKVDKSFLWAEGESEESHVIFENMLALIRGLHRQAVVEGVETQTQRDMLTTHGVEYLQGFYYSGPVPEQDFLDYLKQFNAKR